jgi:hypothetical protein
MNVKQVTEHEDGSATVVFDMNPEELQGLLQYALLNLIKEMIARNEPLKND